MLKKRLDKPNPIRTVGIWDVSRRYATSRMI
jgi:hypothetical protein